MWTSPNYSIPKGALFSTAAILSFCQQMGTQYCTIKWFMKKKIIWKLIYKILCIIVMSIYPSEGQFNAQCVRKIQQIKTFYCMTRLCYVNYVLKGFRDK